MMKRIQVSPDFTYVSHFPSTPRSVPNIHHHYCCEWIESFSIHDHTISTKLKSDLLIDHDGNRFSSLVCFVMYMQSFLFYYHLHSSVCYRMNTWTCSFLMLCQWWLSRTLSLLCGDVLSSINYRFVVSSSSPARLSSFLHTSFVIVSSSVHFHSIIVGVSVCFLFTTDHLHLFSCRRQSAGSSFLLLILPPLSHVCPFVFTHSYSSHRCHRSVSSHSLCIHSSSSVRLFLCCRQSVSSSSLLRRRTVSLFCLCHRRPVGLFCLCHRRSVGLLVFHSSSCRCRFVLVRRRRSVFDLSSFTTVHLLSCCRRSTGSSFLLLLPSSSVRSFVFHHSSSSRRCRPVSSSLICQFVFTPLSSVCSRVFSCFVYTSILLHSLLLLPSVLLTPVCLHSLVLLPSLTVS